MRVEKNQKTTSGVEHAVIEGTLQGKIYPLRRRKHPNGEDLSPFWYVVWFVPPRTMTDRHIAVYGDCNFFLRRWPGDRQRGMHELRKHAGSQVYTQTKNLSMAAEFLRKKEGLPGSIMRQCSFPRRRSA